MSDAAHSPPDMIYDRGLQCLKLFRDCLATEDALAVLQPYEERFWAWANQLKVFSKPHISLDAQLKYDKFDRLRQAVYLLLDVLRDNLQLGACYERLSGLYILDALYSRNFSIEIEPERRH
jgi:hypothetical protein